MENIAALYKKELKQLYRAGKHSSMEPLLKPVALALARINHRLNSSYTELSEQILEILWPSISKPMPAVGIVQIEGSEHIIRQGSLLKVSVEKGQAYYFKTVYSMNIYPIQIKKIHFFNKKIDSGILKINLCINKNSKKLSVLKDKLRFYINMNFKNSCLLYELLFNQVHKISLKINENSKIYHSDRDSITIVGLNMHDLLLFDLKSIMPPEQIIVDFFSHPNKFLFFDLNLSMFNVSVPLTSNLFDIVFHFSSSSIALSREITENSVLLNCTPIINLFDHPSEYIKFDHKQIDYQVRPQKMGDDEFNIYNIKHVWQIDTVGNTTKLPPFNGLTIENFNSNLFWSLRKKNSGKNFNEQMRLIFSDKKNIKNFDISYIKANLLCSNKSVDVELSKMDFKLMNEGHPIENIKLLNKMSSPFLVEKIKDKWHFIMLLSTETEQMLKSNNQLSVLKELLLSMPIEKKYKRNLLLSSILSFTIIQNHQRIFKKNIAYYVQGLNINIIFDDTKVRWAEFFLFWQVLKNFFSIKYSCYAPISFFLLGVSSKKEASYVFFPKD